MQDLLKQYYDAKLAKYKTRMDERGALVAAKYALDDMTVNVKRNLEIYKDESIVCQYIEMEIEDVMA